MTFKTTVTSTGWLEIGEAAQRAGFKPGQLVEVIVTRTGSLIVATDDTPITTTAPYREPLTRRGPALPIAPEIVSTRPRGHIPTTEERMRIGASRIGTTLAEYRRRIENGEKWCSACQQWHPRTEMVRRRSRPDGLDGVCCKAHLARVRLKREAAS